MPHEADDDVLPAGTSVRVKGLRNDRQLNDAQVRLRVTGSFQRVELCVHSQCRPLLLFGARVRSRSMMKLPNDTQ